MTQTRKKPFAVSVDGLYQAIDILYGIEDKLVTVDWQGRQHTNIIHTEYDDEDCRSYINVYRTKMYLDKFLRYDAI